jgi:hypothetical protein
MRLTSRAVNSPSVLIQAALNQEKPDFSLQNHQFPAV